MKTLALVLAAVLFVTLENVVGVSDETLGRPFISSALAEAKSRVDQAYKYTRDLSKTKYKKRSLSPSDLLSFFKQPAADTRSAVRAAEYMENTLSLITQRVHKIHRRSLNATDILTPEDLSVIARLTGCEARITVPSCNTNALVDKYRTITSVCNNKRNPRLGASNTPLSRWLPSQYEDGIHLPKGWDPNRLYSGFHLPLARAVSNHILHTSNDNLTQDNDFAYMLVLFGQWTDHDLGITPTSPSVRSFSKGIHCDESCDQASPCFPIKIPPNDTRIHDTDSCIPFFRSAPACGTGTTGYMFGNANTREQINALTSFVDASMVYGSEEPLSRKLRNLKSDLGLMAVNDEFRDDGLEFLPFNKMEMNMCATRRSATSDQSLSEVECFHAGDARVNENIGLTAIHTLFVREHNRLARELKKLNPHWNGEILFQEARKIMGAYHQILIYREYLPRIVGREAVDTYLKTYSGYDESVDPGVANVFSTAAFRFAHLTIQPFMFRLNETYQEHPEYPSVLLHKAFFTPWRLVFEGGVDPILRGLIGKPAKLNTQDKMMHEELRERLFKLTSHLALDLGSLNIQRSRDHGLPGYNDWRRFCGLSEPKTVNELAEVLSNRNLSVKLLGLYGSPDNIDIWMGGISEPFASNARVGPLFACLIATQFQKIRNGDRFWWEKSGTFTESQRNSLRTVSLSRIICDNTKIQEVPENVFQYRPYSQGYTRCSQIPSFDLSPWQENTSAASSGNYIRRSPPELKGTTEHPEQTGGSASSAPQGPKGEKGDSGPEGMKGDIGPAGPPESSRPPGPSGPPEPSRPPGPSGPPEPSRPPGPSGPPEPSRIPGPPEPARPPGPSGPPGSPEPSRPPGPSGRPGPSGPPEPSRPPGSSGPPGPPEPARPPGPSRAPGPPGSPGSSSGSEQ